MNLATELAERRLVPDSMLRTGIRSLLRRRLTSESARASTSDALGDFTRSMASAPVALSTREANTQHYEVPAPVLRGRARPAAQVQLLPLDRGRGRLGGGRGGHARAHGRAARLADGQRILELGCGWGSLTLWMAQHFPSASIVAVSNSHSQREFIEAAPRLAGSTTFR